MSTQARPQPHILVFPYPAQGHMLPLLDLTHQLALGGLPITIVVTPKNLPNLKPLLSFHPDTIETLVLPFPSHPKLPSGVENISEVGISANNLFICALSKLKDPIIEWFESHPAPPVAIISDLFLGWTQKLGNHLGIPRIAFYCCAAFSTCVARHCIQNLRAVKYSGFIQFPDIPGSPTFKQEHVPSTSQRNRELDPDEELEREISIANSMSWGFILNTFEAMEGPYLDYLRQKILGHPRVYGLGPLSLRSIGNGMVRGDVDPALKCNVFNWLEQCEDESVLYVCFGSQKMLKREQMEALANGLEQSKTRFIWVVKVGMIHEEDNGHGVVPDGFEDRVSGRGLVIRGWVPQVAILNHPAVGGFLGYCGWNSLLEGLVGGVMILGWPMEADQFVNAKLFEDLGVAVRVCEGPDALPDPNHLSRVISETFRENNDQKVRTKALRDEAIKAISNEGSSCKEFDRLLNDLAQL
ncbi:hypothetical protein L6164_001865 [Bauhinia variegata]|uniref:Uncharacterized protein n=1 Tax=Bauhinia variegata TaxID=167791 RepID=A0ACB9QAT3_BAUVA|nr:hypothetical protein L6164_001865 [Bauhinia variegata]